MLLTKMPHNNALASMLLRGINLPQKVIKHLINDILITLVIRL
ncbi:hypothetical protein N654_0903 [Lactiplantibacillus plantarum 4_3]|uniref:Uncharacterized protein n=2 Tax=Lactiplantibacillus plantarum TaxID=1590 RepID=A0AAW3RLS1_LACPN|nr:hypothetical protein LPLWJ_31300 [Lactiplantibacillus plantarum WJL]ETF12650.1 hypothetical protein N654_0903 [Lactiplantibacillus plantarum 4_3]KZU57789.1 hypothetical protein Nizo2814_3195 [Lactiplantibacillus plantarum]KPN42577.1 hypothetical protein WJL_2027 [Lactiplantibacillus plantarum WJL]KZV01258.1 hypothetical protein NAB1_1650 [Lactiplantibacillus plantarum]